MITPWIKEGPRASRGPWYLLLRLGAVRVQVHRGAGVGVMPLRGLQRPPPGQALLGVLGGLSGGQDDTRLEVDPVQNLAVPRRLGIGHVAQVVPDRGDAGR